jgi:predicted permease
VVNWRVVTPGYFATVGIPVLRGRGIAPQDRAGAPQVALVNRSLAERYWPGEDPLGRRLRIDLEGPQWLTVVGVVGDVRQDGLDRETLPEIYRPLAQNQRNVGLALVVRAAGDPRALMTAVREATWAIDPNAPTGEVRTLDEVLAQSVAGPRLVLGLLAGFAALALFLGAVGIFGAVSQEVGRRTHELGVRLALGARRWQVVRLALGRGAAMFLAGSLLGAAASLGLGGVLARQLYGVEAGDPWTLLAVAAVLGVVAAVAAVVPARRAAAIEPVEALRGE